MSGSDDPLIDVVETDLEFDSPQDVREAVGDALDDLRPPPYRPGGSGNVGPKVSGIDLVDSSGAVYEFEADVYDPEDSAAELTYEWQVDGEAVGGDSRTLEHAFQSEGDVDVTVTVTDTGGKSHSGSRTVSIDLPDPDDRFAVDDFGIVRPFQPQGIECRVSDADGDDDVVALRLSVEPDGRASTVEPDAAVLTDPAGPVASIEGDLTPIDGFGSFVAKLEAADLDRYSGTVSTPVDGDDVDDDDFVTLDSVTARIQD